jgi:hypothetical protein
MKHDFLEMRERNEIIDFAKQVLLEEKLLNQSCSKIHLEIVDIPVFHEIENDDVELTRIEHETTNSKKNKIQLFK